MKRFAGWAACAGLIFATSAANAQMLAPYQVGWARYQAASDFDQPYAGPPAPPYAYEATALPPPTAIRGVPRPPLPIPNAESRVVPLPAPKPATARIAAGARTSAEVGTAPPTAPPGQVSEAKPKPLAPQILPTQEMPKVQALE